MILIISCDFKYATSSCGQLLNSGASAMFDTWKIFVLTSFSWQCGIQTCYSSLKTSRLQPDTVMLKCDILHLTSIQMQFILFKCVFTLSSFCLQHIGQVLFFCLQHFLQTICKQAPSQNDGALCWGFVLMTCKTYNKINTLTSMFCIVVYLFKNLKYLTQFNKIDMSGV